MPEPETLLQPYRDMEIAPYAAACRRRLAHQTTFEILAADCDAVLMPAATGAAPAREDTGDAVMSRFWTALHVPAMAVPFWSSRAGRPLGLQVVGRFGTDRALAAVAQWLFENALTLGGTPPQLVTGV
jgi:Asp-tRNA(Asn)/Glu-tRNA(Gln) amidotransferase A subunit family amidase